MTAKSLLEPLDELRVFWPVDAHEIVPDGIIADDVPDVQVGDFFLGDAERDSRYQVGGDACASQLPEKGDVAVAVDGVQDDVGLCGLNFSHDFGAIAAAKD